MEKAAEKVEIAVLGGVGFNSYMDFESPASADPLWRSYQPILPL